MSYGGRLRAEIQVFKAAWRQIDTFVDRIMGAQDADEPEALRVSKLLEAMSLLELGRRFAYDTWLDGALPSNPGGVNLSVTGASLEIPEDTKRLPGPEDIEATVASSLHPAGAMLAGLDNVVFTGIAWFPQDMTIETLDPEGNPVDLIVPAYDFGRVRDPGPIDFAITVPDERALFPFEDAEGDVTPRTEAAMSGTATLKTWSAEVAARRDAFEEPRAPTVFEAFEAAATDDEWTAVAATLSSHAGLASYAANRLIGLEEELRDADVHDDGIEALALVQVELAAAGLQFEAAAQMIERRAEFGDWKTRAWSSAVLAVNRAMPVDANGLVLPGFYPELPSCYANAEALLAQELDIAIDSRIAYPDGGLRQLRTMEWSFVQYWAVRRAWFSRRRRTVLLPILEHFLATIRDSFQRMRQGTGTGAMTTTTLAKQVIPRARELEVRGHPALPKFQTGRLVYVGGDRPTIAMVLRYGRSGADTVLLVDDLRVSVDVAPELEGLPGLIPAGAPVRDRGPAVSPARMIAGRAARTEDNAVVESLVALHGRLALFRGVAYAGAALMPSDSIVVEGPVEPGARRLQRTLGANEAEPRVRRGELLLIRGRDENGVWWQGALQVESFQVVTKAELEAQGDTLTCKEDERVLLVFTQDLTITKTLVESVTLRRDFAGFSSVNLAVAEIVPEDLYADDSSSPGLAELLASGRFWSEDTDDKLYEGGAEVHRHPELSYAARILERWTREA